MILLILLLHTVNLKNGRKKRLSLFRNECLVTIPVFQYHIFVAVKKTGKNSSIGSHAVVVFWLVFIIVIISVFMVNAETIKTNFNLFKTKLTGAGQEILPEEDDSFIVIEEQPSSVSQPSSATQPDMPAAEPSAQTQTSQPAQTTESTPSAAQPVQPQPQPTRTPPSSATQPQAEPARTTDRVVYFTLVSSDGQILQSRVTRRIPVSNSPMLDALNLLLTGPSAEEISRGLLNFIPQNTRILTATIRGTTAYINFSEDFLFNRFGIEGYVAQLRQIVWTVTEFQTVNDVQILIEGRRMDYLGEGIWIGSPINRQSF